MCGASSIGQVRVLSLAVHVVRASARPVRPRHPCSHSSSAVALETWWQVLRCLQHVAVACACVAPGGISPGSLIAYGASVHGMPDVARKFGGRAASQAGCRHPWCTGRPGVLLQVAHNRLSIYKRMCSAYVCLCSVVPVLVCVGQLSGCGSFGCSTARLGILERA